MKKNSLLIIAIALILASCGQKENEWGRFYGFTQDDIVGHYEANPDQSLYEPLPNEVETIYDNASIDVTAAGSSSISLHIVIPDVINKSFTGPINTASGNQSNITMANIINNYNKEDIMLTVYKNAKGQVRFHGRVKHYRYSSQPGHENELVQSENWGFDVIKEE